MKRAISIILAVAMVIAISFVWGWHTGVIFATTPPDYGEYNVEQLGHVIEGIMERASDSVDRVRRLQEEKMAEVSAAKGRGAVRRAETAQDEP